MAKQYKVTTYPRASRQLIVHVEFLSRKSVNAAVRLSAEYKAVIQALKENPFQFPVDLDSDLEDPPRVALFAKRYQIYFDVEGQNSWKAFHKDCYAKVNVM